MSDDDDNTDLFRRAIAGTRILKPDSRPPDKPKPAPLPTQRFADERKVMDELRDDPGEEWQELSGDELNYARSGISQKIMHRLRKGYYKIEAELDLHGLRREQAKKELLWFMAECRVNRFRCVRIIHGKGQRSPDKIPVLKTKTAYWLKQMDDVLAYCTAPPTDGGTGALYVLLKKPR